MYMGVLHACMSAYLMCAWYLWKSVEGVGCSRDGVIDSGKPNMGGENHWSCLKTQAVLLTTEPSLQSLSVFFKGTSTANI